MKKSTIFKILLVLVAISWGSGFPITKVALDSGMEPNAIICIRFIIASTLLYLYLFGKKIKIKKGEWKLGLTAGFFLGLGFSLQTVGLSYTTASKNAFLTGAYVILVPFFLWFFTKKRPKPMVYISSILCFTGIGFLSINGDLSVKYGDLLSLMCAFFYAFQISFIGANIKKYNPLSVNAVQMSMCGVLCLIFNIFFEGFSIVNASVSMVEIYCVGFLILSNTLFAYLVQTAAQQYVYPSTVALILSTEIVFASITSILFFGEILTTKTLIGGSIIFISVLIAESNFNLSKFIKFKVEE